MRSLTDPNNQVRKTVILQSLQQVLFSLIGLVFAAWKTAAKGPAARAWQACVGLPGDRGARGQTVPLTSLCDCSLSFSSLFATETLEHAWQHREYENERSCSVHPASTIVSIRPTLYHFPHQEAQLRQKRFPDAVSFQL